MGTGCDQSGEPVAAPPVRTASPSISGPEEAVPGDNAAVAGPESAAETAASAADSGSSSFQSFDGMKFNVPGDWKQLPLSSMQIGIVAGKLGMPAISDDISLTLSTSGGSVEDNLSRWEGQFSGGAPMQRETLTIDGTEAILVRLQGTFSAGFGKSPEADWRMTGVIIPMEKHNYFIKLTGPSADVARVEDQFLAFCRSARRD